MRLFRRKKKTKKKRLPALREFEKYPPGIRYYVLSDYASKVLDTHSMKEYQFYRTAYSKIEDDIVNRNNYGIALEKEGKIDQAIALYEKNVSDYAHTPHPFKRLRIIYRRQKRFDDAIRICKAYIHCFNEHARILGKPDWKPKPGNEYEIWIGKLEIEKEKYQQKP